MFSARNQRVRERLRHRQTATCRHLIHRTLIQARGNDIKKVYFNYYKTTVEHEKSYIPDKTKAYKSTYH